MKRLIAVIVLLLFAGTANAGVIRYSAKRVKQGAKLTAKYGAKAAKFIYKVVW